MHAFGFRFSIVFGIVFALTFVLCKTDSANTHANTNTNTYTNTNSVAKTKIPDLPKLKDSNLKQELYADSESGTNFVEMVIYNLCFNTTCHNLNNDTASCMNMTCAENICRGKIVFSENEIFHCDKNHNTNTLKIKEQDFSTGEIVGIVAIIIFGMFICWGFFLLIHEKKTHPSTNTNDDDIV